MRIALVSPYDWAVPGGVNRHVINLSQHFMRHGHDVMVVAPASKRTNDEPAYLHVIGHASIGLPASGSVANVSLSYNLSSRVKKLLAREAFDVVHMHEPFQPLLPFQFVRYSTATNIATFHAARDTGSRIYAYTKAIIQPWWHNIHGKIAHSQAALDLVGKYFEDEFRVIGSGIDYAHFAQETPPIPELMDSKRNIVFVGRQEQRKGLPYLLEAYAIVKKEMPGTRLIIVGPDGGMRPGALRFIEENRLEDVVFTDFVSYDDLPRYYRSGDVFCAPNTGHESLGLILLEAMAAGVPLVASRIPGFAAVVKDGEQGLLVPPRDASALAEALKRLLSDAGMREAMGKAGAAHARAWTWEEVSSKVLAFYEETAAKRRNGNGA
ncbi:MAG TPA: glycosyltransferase family 4 protein [Dehalococcoidia bacterium]|nr:glycosyltransferase family 4 protein [Dehalococcoidia bacterium]